MRERVITCDAGWRRQGRSESTPSPLSNPRLVLYCWQPHHYSRCCCPPPPAPLRSHHHLRLYIPLASPPPITTTLQRFLCYAWLRPTRCLIHPVTHLSIHPADRTLLPPSLRHISARTSGFASRAYYTTHLLHTYTHTTHHKRIVVVVVVATARLCIPARRTRRARLFHPLQSRPEPELLPRTHVSGSH